MLFAVGFAGPVLAAPKAPSRVIVQANAYPWSALGRVNTGGRGYCTGTLISDRHVLTRARCLYNTVEGRWWDKTELHFVAGYERDTYRVNAPVAKYRVAGGYAGGADMTLADLLNNWALLTLDARIGREAGWMKVQWLDGSTLDRIKRGDIQILDAGYRRGQDHVVTVTLSCSVDGAMRRQLVASGGCASLAFDPGLSTLLFVDGELRVLGSRSMRKDTGFRNVSARSSSGAPDRAARKSGGRMVRAAVTQLFGAADKSPTGVGRTVTIPPPAPKPALQSEGVAENNEPVAKLVYAAPSTFQRAAFPLRAGKMISRSRPKPPPL